MRVLHQTLTACAAAVIAAAVLPGCSCHAKGRPEMRAGEASEVPSRGADRSSGKVVELPAGARAAYPLDWEPAASRDFALMLLPAKSPARSAEGSTGLRWGEHFISLDIPELPAFRIPGFLPMGRIRAGYLDHLRKQAPGAKAQDLEPPPIPDAQAALVRTTWPEERPTHVETALILTHDDRVYILRGRSRTEDEPATRDAFDQVARSLRWEED